MLVLSADVILQDSVLARIIHIKIFLFFYLSVLVSSGGVTAQITRGDITMGNGVIHIIDRMLGFVYNTAVEQIAEDAG